MKTEIKNFYIIGKVMGGQRTENLIKFLLDKNYPVYYNSFKNTKGSLSFFHILFTKTSSILNLIMSDVVILPAMCNNYQFEFKVASWLKKKIVTDFYISLYDTHVLDKKPLGGGKLVDSNTNLATKFKNIDRDIIKKATFTLFLNSTEAIYYLKVLDLNFDPNKHLILPICADNKLICELNYYLDKSQNVFNICWWGSYIPLHGLEKIIMAAKVLKENYNLNFHLHLFGNNEEKSKPYVDLIIDLDLANVVTLYNDKTFSNGKLGSFLKNNCDLVLGNFGDSEKAKNVIVNKIIDGVAMKAPVLSGESKAPLEFFSNDDLFYIQNVPEAIAHSITKISECSPADIETRVLRSYLIYKENFSIESYNRKLQMVLNKL